MGETLVTVGLTTYNAADTIERAFRSALMQSWRPIEIVAIDDCSTDETPEILKRLTLSHSELRAFYNKVNCGVAGSRNQILAEARGEFVAFFDDDDESLPDRVEAQIRRLLAYEQDFAGGASVICHTARRLVYPGGTEQIAPTMGQRLRQPVPSGLSVAERILLGFPLEDGYGGCAACSQMGRLSTYQMLGGFDSSFRRSEDTDLNIRLAKAGAHFVGIDDPLVIQNMTRTIDKNLDDERRYNLMLLEKHQDVPNEYGLYGFCRSWIDLKHSWLKGRFFVYLFRLMKLVLRHPWLTLCRLGLAVPNVALNRSFGRFFTKSEY